MENQMTSKVGRLLSVRGSNAVMVAAVVSLLAVQFVPPVLAQPVRNAIDKRPVCMVLALSDDQKLSVILPRSDAKTMRAKGFKKVDCKKAFGSRKAREEYRDSICGIASEWREELQDNFERVNGERPAVLCGMAEVAMSSQWKRRGRR